MPYKNLEKNKEYHKEYYKKWSIKNKEKIRNNWQKYYYTHKERIDKTKKKQRVKREQTYQVRARRYHRKRIEILKMYSGDIPTCANCGEERYECLQIDHIKDDGYLDRRSNRNGGENLYHWLLKQPYQPDRYQVLCANCNTIKRLRGIVSYQQGFKNIKEWEMWAKCKNIKTPKKIKKLWLLKKEKKKPIHKKGES